MSDSLRTDKTNLQEETKTNILMLETQFNNNILCSTTGYNSIIDVDNNKIGWGNINAFNNTDKCDSNQSDTSEIIMSKNFTSNSCEENDLKEDVNNSVFDCVTCSGCPSFDRLDDDKKNTLRGLRDLHINDLNENFNSRDLLKIIIYLTKVNKFDPEVAKYSYFFQESSDIYRCLRKYRKLSLRGIKYWNLISREKPLNFIFMRYRPWSIHTIYKRIFSIFNLEDVYLLYVHNHKMDVREIMKLVKKKKEESEMIKNDSETKLNNYNHSDTTIDNDNISLNKMSNSKGNSYKFNNNTQVNEEGLQLGYFDVLGNKYPNRYFPINHTETPHDFLQKKKFYREKESDNFILGDMIKIKQDPYDNPRNRLSNLNGVEENSKEKSINYGSDDYKGDRSIMYMTVLNQDEKKRNFYFKDLGMADVNYNNKYKQIKLISNLCKKYHGIYDENFVIESLMRVSNYEEDLREYLKDPIKNTDILWTILEDEIILDFLKIENNEANHITKLVNKIVSIKGKERVKRRIEFLKQYNQSTFK